MGTTQSRPEKGVDIADIRAFEEGYYLDMPDSIRAVVETKHEGLSALYGGDAGDALEAFRRAERNMLEVANGITGTHADWVRYRRESYGIAGPSAVAACLADEKAACISAMSSLHCGPVQYIAFSTPSIPTEFEWFSSGVYDRYQIYQAPWEAILSAYTGQSIFPTVFYRGEVRQERVSDMMGALLETDKVMFDDTELSDDIRASDAVELELLCIAGDMVNGEWYSPEARKELVRFICEQAVAQKLSFGQVELA